MPSSAIAPMSSKIASVRRNTRSWSGHRGPTSARTPTTNAVSVDIGTPQPEKSSPDGLSRMKRPIGTASPPIAPKRGTDAARKLRSSPTVSSRLTSSPTTRKKIAIAPSLIQWCSERSMLPSPIAMLAGVDQNSSYEWPARLAHSSAAADIARSRVAPPDSVER